MKQLYKAVFLIITVISLILEYMMADCGDHLMAVVFGFIALTNIILFMKEYDHNATK